MNRELECYVVLYNDTDNNQIVKPFFDDENGRLKVIAIVNVYLK